MFAEREQRAREGTDELARWLMAEHVAQYPCHESGVEVRCPLCQGPVHKSADRSPEPAERELMTRRGKIAYRREAVLMPMDSDALGRESSRC